MLLERKHAAGGRDVAPPRLGVFVGVLIPELYRVAHRIRTGDAQVLGEQVLA